MYRRMKDIHTPHPEQFVSENRGSIVSISFSDRLMRALVKYYLRMFERRLRV